MNIQVRIPDHLDAQWLTNVMEFGFDGPYSVEVGKGQTVNGIPLNTILVQVEEA